MDMQLSPTNALRTRNTCYTCLVLVTWLCSCQYLLSPLEYVKRGKSSYAALWLRGYAVVKTTALPQNMLVGKVAMWLYSVGFLRSYVAIFTQTACILRVCIAA